MSAMALHSALPSAQRYVWTPHVAGCSWSYGVSDVGSFLVVSAYIENLRCYILHGEF